MPLTVFDKGLITVVACDALFAALSLPLIRRKVPPNAAYGYRTPAVLRDAALWYDANEHFGRRFFAASVVSALAALAVSPSGVLSAETFLPATVVLLALPVVVAGVSTTRFVRGWTRG